MNKEKQIQTILTIAAGFLAFYLFTHHKWLLISAFVIILIGIFSDFLTEKNRFILAKVRRISGKY